MNEFVEECRREWKRLRVPDPAANEMAADLAADLAEAEAEGASPEEVLGSGAFDPRSFAASWASERGVIGPAPVTVEARRSRLPAAIAAFALIAIIGAILALVASPSGPARLALASPTGGRIVSPAWKHVKITVRGREVPQLRLRIPPPPGVGIFGPAPADRVLAVATSGSGIDLRPIGVVVLLVGLVGTILSTLAWLGVGAGRLRGRSAAYH